MKVLHGKRLKGKHLDDIMREHETVKRGGKTMVIMKSNILHFIGKELVGVESFKSVFGGSGDPISAMGEEYTCNLAIVHMNRPLEELPQWQELEDALGCELIITTGIKGGKLLYYPYYKKTEETA